MTQQLSPQALRIVRFALVSGIAGFLIVALFVPLETRPDPSLVQLLTYLTFAFSAAAIAGALVLRGLVEKAATLAEAARYCIVAWALGESGAVLGVVTLFLSGTWPAAAAGIIAFLAVLTLVPIPDRAGA